MYIFPVKLLEYSAPISVAFSILLNLGFGFLLDYTLQVTIKLGYGTVFYCLLSFVMVPVIPNAVKLVDYFNEMVTFSISRLGMMGFFLFISCFQSLKQGELFYVTWTVTSNLSWMLIAQAGFLVYSTLVIIVFRWQEYRVMPLAFVVLLGGVGYLGYMDSFLIY